MEPMTDQRLAEIREREQAATPGPWGPSVDIADEIHPWEVVRSGDLPPVELEADAQGQADAAFITAARRDVADLLAEVERLRERLKLAENVCVMFGWSPVVDHESERAKATTMLWRRWLDHVGGTFIGEGQHPDLSDAVIAALARDRDNLRNQALAKLRDEEA